MQNKTPTDAQALMLEDQLRAAVEYHHHADNAHGHVHEHGHGHHDPAVAEFTPNDIQTLLLADENHASHTAHQQENPTSKGNSADSKSQTKPKETVLHDSKDTKTLDSTPVSDTSYDIGTDGKHKHSTLQVKDNKTTDKKNNKVADNKTNSVANTNETDTKANTTLETQNNTTTEDPTAAEPEAKHTNAGPLTQDTASEKANHHKEKKTEKTIQHVTQKNITLPGGHQVVETKTKTVEVKVTETTKISAEKNKNSSSKHDPHASNFEAVVDEAIKGIIEGNASKESDSFSKDIKSIKDVGHNEAFHLEPETKSEKATSLKQNTIDSPEVKAALAKELAQLETTNADTRSKAKNDVIMTSKKAKFNITHGNSKKTETEIDLRGKISEPKQPEVALIVVGNDAEGLGSATTDVALGLNEVHNHEAPTSDVSSARELIANTLRKDLEKALAAETFATDPKTPKIGKTNDIHSAMDNIPSPNNIVDGHHGQTHIHGSERRGMSHGDAIVNNELYQHDSVNLRENAQGGVANMGALKSLLGKLMLGQGQGAGGSKNDESVFSNKCINLIILSPDGFLRKIGSPNREISMTAGQSASTLSKKLDMGVEVSGPRGEPQSLQLGLSSDMSGMKSGVSLSQKDHAGTHSAEIGVRGKKGLVGVNLNDAGMRAGAAELDIKTKGVGKPDNFYLLMVGSDTTEKGNTPSHGQQSGSIASNNLEAKTPNTYMASTQESGLVKAIGVDMHNPLHQNAAVDNTVPYHYTPFEGIEPITPTYDHLRTNGGIQRGIETTFDQKSLYDPGQGHLSTKKDKSNKDQNVVHKQNEPIFEKSVENSLNRNDAQEPDIAKLADKIHDSHAKDQPPADKQDTRSAPADNVLATDTVHKLNKDGTLETQEKAGLNKSKKAEKTSQQVTKKEIQLPTGENMVETKAKTVEVKVTETTNVTAEKNTSRTDAKNTTADENIKPKDEKEKSSGLRTVVDKAIDGIKKELYGGKSEGASHEIKSIKPTDINELSNVEAKLHKDVKTSLDQNIIASSDQNIIGSPDMDSALSNGFSKLAKVTKNDNIKKDIQPGVQKTSKKAKFNIAHGNSKKTVTEIDLREAKPKKKQPELAIIVVGNDGNGPDSSFKGLAQSLDQISHSDTAPSPVSEGEIIGTIHERDLKKFLAAETSALAQGLPGSPENIDLRSPTGQRSGLRQDFGVSTEVSNFGPLHPNQWESGGSSQTTTQPTVFKSQDASQNLPNDFEMARRRSRFRAIPHSTQRTDNSMQASRNLAINHGPLVSQIKPSDFGVKNADLNAGLLPQNRWNPGHKGDSGTTDNSRQPIRSSTNDFRMDSSKEQIHNSRGIRPDTMFNNRRDSPRIGNGQRGKNRDGTLTYDTEVPPFTFGVTGIPIQPQDSYLSPITETSSNRQRGDRSRTVAGNDVLERMERLRNGRMNRFRNNLADEQHGSVNVRGTNSRRGKWFTEDIRSIPNGDSGIPNIPRYNPQNRLNPGTHAHGSKNGKTGSGIHDIRFVDLTGGNTNTRNGLNSGRQLQSGTGGTSSTQNKWNSPVRSSTLRNAPVSGNLNRSLKNGRLRTSNSDWNNNRNAVKSSVRGAVGTINGGIGNGDIVTSKDLRSDNSQERSVWMLRPDPSPIRVIKTKNNGATHNGRNFIGNGGGHVSRANNGRGGRGRAGSLRQTRDASALNGRRSLVARHFSS